MSAIDNLDLDPIKVKLMDTHDGESWSFEKVEAICIKYRRFLTLNLENPKAAIVPTQDIDTFWHYHILDTIKYAEDCTQCFGYFLHHFPYFGLRGAEDAKNLADAFEATKALYEARFGERLASEEAEAAETDCKVGCGQVACKIGNCKSNSTSGIRPKLLHSAASLQ